MSRTLRDYQQQCVQHVHARTADSLQRLMYTIPTGTGKTAIGAALVKAELEQGGRVLWIAHRKELVKQAAQTLAEDTGYFVGVCMGDMGDDTTSQCIVASVQTLTASSCRRLHALCGYNDVTMVFIDESHHATIKNSYNTVISYIEENNPLVKVVGCTATPYRSDKESLLITECAFSRDIPTMIADKWLSPVLWKMLDLSLDLSKVRTGQVDGERDYNQQDVSDQLMPQLELLVQKTMLEIGTRQTVVFCPSVDAAQQLAACYRAHGVVADCIWGDMKKDDRDTVLYCWQHGVVQVVTNVAILTEGFDYVPLEPFREGLGCVIVATATQSPGRYLQMVGRGTRLKYGEIKDCLVLDVGGGANLLESKQIILPKLLPYLDDSEFSSITDETTVSDLSSRAPVSITEMTHPKRPYSMRIPDPFTTSWASWGTYQGQHGMYLHMSLGSSGTMSHYIVLMPARDGSGLYQGFMLNEEHYEWTFEQLFVRPMLLGHCMHHVNLLIAQMNARALIDKNAQWRKKTASSKQLNYLSTLAPKVGQQAQEERWSMGEVSHAINWQKIRNVVGKKIIPLLEKEKEGTHV